MLFTERETGLVCRKIGDCAGRYEGMCLWQPMKKVGFFYLRDCRKKRFILDDSTFEPHKKKTSGEGKNDQKRGYCRH